MRIAYYNHTSAVSGAEMNLMVTAKHYTKAHPVIFAPEGELLDRARKDWFDVVPMASFNARLSRNPFRLAAGLIGMIKAGWQLSEAVKEQDIQVIHANSLRAGMMASLFSRRHRIPVVWHLHDIPPKGLTGWLIRMYAMRAAQSVIAISEPVMKDYLKLGKRIQLVHNGAVLSESSDKEKEYIREKIRMQLNTPLESKVMTIIGQIAPWKRQEDAIRALHALVQQGEESYLWIVGEPKFRQENEKYLEELYRLAEQLKVKKYVRFTGFREDIDEICCAVDLLLLCSENEPFGRVIIEAMAQGTPVIATSGGGVSEIIQHGRSGLLYTTGHILELVQCIKNLQGDKQLYEQISANSMERVKDYFSIEQAAAKTEQIYLHLMTGGKGNKQRTPASWGGGGMNGRIAIVHDYLNQMGGAERVVGVMHKLFPEAPIYTTIVDREKLMPELREADIRSTWMQRIPNILRDFKFYFWLYPFAVRSMDFKNYDIIISSSSAYAKGIRKPDRAVHLCYCHSPMRFAWNFDGYMENVKVSRLRKIAAKWLTFPLRLWDKANSKQVDRLIANSSVVKERINKYYGLESTVIYPPVDVERFSISEEAPGDYFLIVSRLVSYKRIDIAIEACSRLGRKLLIIGDGDDRKRLEAMAGPTVQFLGRRSDEEVTRYMQGCRALLFPGLEDFGITPLEANACGRPVIAFEAGGALDTIKSGLNGLFFKEQNAGDLLEALHIFEQQQWNPQLIREHAETFNERFFIERLLNSLQGAIDPLGSGLKQYGVGADIHFGR